jgi:hypothetical protein
MYHHSAQLFNLCSFKNRFAANDNEIDFRILFRISVDFSLLEKMIFFKNQIEILYISENQTFSKFSKFHE